MNVYLVGAKNPETKRQVEAQERHNAKFTMRGFIDNDPAKWGTEFLGYPVLGGLDVVPDLLSRDRDAFFVSLITGSTLARFEVSRVLAELGCRFTNLIHPSVDLTDVTIGVGNYIQDGVILQAGVEIGNNTSIHISALVSHEVSVGDSAFVSFGACVAGEVAIGPGTFVGTNATVLPRVHVGEWATVGAGAVVIADVAPCSTVVGSPARTVRVDAARYSGADIFESCTD